MQWPKVTAMIGLVKFSLHNKEQWHVFMYVRIYTCTYAPTYVYSDIKYLHVHYSTIIVSLTFVQCGSDKLISFEAHPTLPNSTISIQFLPT